VIHVHVILVFKHAGFVFEHDRKNALEIVG
jgi:hypothetical protein